MRMHDIARLLIKIIGLFTLAVGILDTLSLPPLIAAQIREQSSPYVVLVTVLPAFLELAIGIILWRADGRIADSLIFERDADVGQSVVDYRRLEELGIALVGLWLASTELPKLLQLLLRDMATESAGQQTGIAFWYEPAFLSFVQVLIGIGLFLGSRGLSGLRHKLLEARSLSLHNTQDE